MKRFLYPLIIGIASLTIMCCDNATGSSSDESATQSIPTTPTTPVVKGTNASLSKLALSVGILTPAFSPDKLEYTANVDPRFTSITLTGTAADTKATLDANNDKGQSLGDAKTDLSYTVLAEDGVTSKTYKIAITREQDTTAPIISG